MKLSDWAKQQGIRYETAWRWFRDGNLPVQAEQTATGTILVHPESDRRPEGEVALYARVSSADQKADLDRQLGRLVVFAARQGLSVTRTVAEVGSGLNGHRTRLTSLLRTPEIRTIVVEHRDRLCRFGFEYLESALKAQGRDILVVDEKELDDDLVRDMTEVLTSFCSRLYGKRSAKRRAERALEAMGA
jgi:predicted site-specific integrase-resolvase